jgi:hypothetical protein
MTSPVTPSSDDELTVVVERHAFLDANHRRVALYALLSAFKLKFGYDAATVVLSARGPDHTAHEPEPAIEERGDERGRRRTRT